MRWRSRDQAAADAADDFTLDSGMDAVHSLHERKVGFDAIFACNDLLAMGAIRATLDLGRSVPDDVSVVGYDDMPLGASFLPPLCPCGRTGRKAACCWRARCWR